MYLHFRCCFGWSCVPPPPRVQSNITLILSLLAVSVVYWGFRQLFVPIGSENDIHSANFSYLLPTAINFASGFIAQSYTFSPEYLRFWLGGLASLMAFLSLREKWSRVTVLAIFGMCSVIYLSMFGFQDENLMGAQHFIGRLYLIPFALILFVAIASELRPALIMLIAVLSLWGMGNTYYRHVKFQQTFVELYALAEKTDETITVHYPPRNTVDLRRGLRYGDFPDADVRINVIEGGVERQ